MLNIVRHRPAVEMPVLHDIDSLFDDLFRSFSAPGTAVSLPSVDIYSEDDKSMTVEVQAPGFDRDDIEISVNNGALEIRAHKTEKEEHKDKKRSYMVREISANFARRIMLPEGADSENIAAELDKGVLKVAIPVERPQAKRIEIAAPKGKGKAKLTAGSNSKSKTA
jgi:HSP20 family protein